MFNKCKHQWEEVGRTFNPPARYDLEFERGPSSMIQVVREMAFGKTNIELKCSECGDVGFRSVVGKSSPA